MAYSILCVSIHIYSATDKKCDGNLFNCIQINHCAAGADCKINNKKKTGTCKCGEGKILLDVLGIRSNLIRNILIIEQTEENCLRP